MIERKQFGRSDHLSSRVLFGAAALANVTQEEADQTLETLLSYGINHIDTAASYGDAERKIGPWMRRFRKNFFLATKTEMRSYSEAMRELENSLERLQTDVIDLWQMHVLVDEEGWQQAFNKGGVLEAFVEAREKGMVRFLGVTGHGLQAAEFHLRSLERYDFDTVLLPWNYCMSLNESYRSSFNKLCSLCAQRNVVVQTIKSICRRPWPEGVRSYATWYQPIEEQEDVNMAVAFVLSNPQLFLNSVGDIHLLPAVLKAASDYSEGELKVPESVEMDAMKTRLEMESLFV